MDVPVPAGGLSGGETNMKCYWRGTLGDCADGGSPRWGHPPADERGDPSNWGPNGRQDRDGLPARGDDPDHSGSKSPADPDKGK